MIFSAEKSDRKQMKRQNVFRYLLPRLKDVVFLTVFLGVLILGGRMLNADGDLPRHLATGRLILETGKIPLTEPFVYPYLGQPYVPHEWLFGVIFYIIYKYLGMNGIVLCSAFILATTFAILYDHLSKKNRFYFPVFLLTLWGAAASSLHWITRPHLFTMLFLAVWLIWMDRLRSGEPLRLWKFLLVMVIWCNVHAEFIMGILVTIAFLAGWIWERRMKSIITSPEVGKRLLIVLAASLPVTLINPAGYQPWLRVINYVRNDYLMSVINETNPPDFQQPVFMVLLALIIFSVFLMVRNFRKAPRADILLISGATLLTLTSARSVHLYGVLAPFSLAGLLVGLKGIPLIDRLEGALIRVEGQLNVYCAAILTVLISLSVILFGDRIGLYQFDSRIFPVQAVEWLNEHPQKGNVFNDFNWGGYLILERTPDQLVFIDSMSDHSGILTTDYARATAPEGDWQAIFDKYQVRWVILPRDSALSLSLPKISSWDVIYSDDTTTILSYDVD